MYKHTHIHTRRKKACNSINHINNFLRKARWKYQIIDHCCSRVSKVAVLLVVWRSALPLATADAQPTLRC